MFYIIETEDQLSRLHTDCTNCFINIIPLNDNFHPKLSETCLIYYKCPTSKGYLFTINHSEAFKLPLQSVLNYLTKRHERIYTLDKKATKYLIGDELPIIDVNFMLPEALKEEAFNTTIHDYFYNKFFHLKNVNSIIPISKHYEKQEHIFDNISWCLGLMPNEYLNDDYTDVFYNIEKQGIGFDEKLLKKHFEFNWANYSVSDNRIYGYFNLYNQTTRPTNAFNNINFSALKKESGARETFTPINDYLVEFDYSAYHPHIIAKIIGYKWKGNPYDEIPKEVMFQNLYGGIRKEHIHEPFFTKLNDYLDSKWHDFTTDGELDLVMTKLPASRIENPTKNKLLSYIIQSYETYYNVKTLKAVFDYLKNKQTKIVLYTYDSFLFDVSRKDGKKLLTDIKDMLENLGFPTKMKTGDNYGVLN
jgi:hypothetical protein